MKTFVCVTTQEIPAVLDRSMYEADATHGGEVVFRGLVRNVNHGKTVTALSYDAFIPLAEATLQDICAEASVKWGADLHMAVIHRTGRLEIGECAVVVAVSSKHRQEAYEASQYVIEELKMRAPIWKKEHYLDGESEWLQGHALCGHSPSRATIHHHTPTTAHIR